MNTILPGMPVMKFSLTFDGDLRSGNTPKCKDKWAIRRAISPQLAELWATHPTLKIAQGARYIPKEKPFGWFDVHHLSDKTTTTPNKPKTADDLDLCELLQVGSFSFLPLVRKSYALVCSLDIIFMRKGPVGRVYQGGDLDNRIKTLLDALSVPNTDEINSAKPSDSPTDPIYCLLENDALVSGLHVDTRQLLSRPGSNEFDVHLVIDVDVRVTHPRSYNLWFLGD